ncbi:MAG: FKBP-type peptidyl-prolyl cis-trans isomerase [bacterium]|nr:FKBP-type peptidyl-prolyl cis-trans isomerase [bacterium]
MKIKTGIELISETEGTGEIVKRHHYYYLQLRLWLNKGAPIIWKHPIGMLDRMSIEDDGTTLTSDFRIDREYLFNGLFYGIEGMRTGGTRVLRISPHMAFGEKGLEDMIPPNAVLKVEVTILGERTFE